MVDAFRSSVDDPEAPFPTLGVKHDATAFAMVYDDPIGTVNAGNQVEFFNPPIVGKRIKHRESVQFLNWAKFSSLTLKLQWSCVRIVNVVDTEGPG